MKLSLNFLKDYVDIEDLDVKQIAEDEEYITIEVLVDESENENLNEIDFAPSHIISHKGRLHTRIICSTCCMDSWLPVQSHHQTPSK